MQRMHGGQRALERAEAPYTVQASHPGLPSRPLCSFNFRRLDGTMSIKARQQVSSGAIESGVPALLLCGAASGLPPPLRAWRRCPIASLAYSHWHHTQPHRPASPGLHHPSVSKLQPRAPLSQAIEDFSRKPEVTVMLVSLKAASLGVNLVSANHVVLLGALRCRKCAFFASLPLSQVALLGALLHCAGSPKGKQ